MGKLPSSILRRPSLASLLPSISPAFTHTPLTSSSIPSTTSSSQLLPTTTTTTQVRHATYILRDRRPYQFTQLVQLSDGSTFTVRTTSPQALYRADKDSRNHVLWNPSEASLRNVEVDEAGKLAAFRGRYGTAWDLTAPEKAGPAGAAAAPSDAAGAKEEVKGKKKGEGEQKTEAVAAPPPQEDEHDSLVDLISAFATVDKSLKGGATAKDAAREEKKKKK
ncbi:hypothetical protein VTJ04DRAFT_7783 [Mycothermus thermophilus]|uniref:mitochondrial 54S ribosomal protein bL31m n=1 Tax=Humicola insolens TaxID=85995 RepID=UPI00374400E0